MGKLPTQQMIDWGFCRDNFDKLLLGLFLIVVLGTVIFVLGFGDDPVDWKPEGTFEYSYNAEHEYLVIRRACSSIDQNGKLIITIDRNNTSQKIIWASNDQESVSNFPIEAGEGTVIPNVRPTDTVLIQWAAAPGAKIAGIDSVKPIEIDALEVSY